MLVSGSGTGGISGTIPDGYRPRFNFYFNLGIAQNSGNPVIH